MGLAQTRVVEATCAALLVIAVDDYARRRGVNLDLDGMRGVAPETQVALAAYYGALERLSAQLDDPLVGAEIAFAMGERGLGALSFLMVTAETVEDALAAIFAHQALLSPAERYARGVTEGRVRLTYRAHGPPRPAHAICAQLFVADVVLNTPPEVEGELTGLTVKLSGAASLRDRLARRLGVPVLEAVEVEGEVAFDEVVLSLRMRHADPTMHAFFVDYVDTRTPANQHDDLVERLRGQVDARLSDGALGAKSSARALGVSTRTLQRRLSEADTTFRGLVAERRLRRARALLAAGRSPVEAALAAGYAEASSLHRALRRATRGRAAEPGTPTEAIKDGE